MPAVSVLRWNSQVNTSLTIFGIRIEICAFMNVQIPFSSVRVWNIERLQGLAQKILPHPSFVYSAQYHPQAPSLVVTGGYDGLLRVWNLDIKDVNGQLLQEFEGHKTFINALCFDSEGTACLCSVFVIVTCII